MIQIHTNSIECHPILSQILGVVKVGEQSQICHKIVIDNFGSVFTAFKIVIDLSLGLVIGQ